MEDKDVAIIGAGPVGLFSVFQCGMLGYSAVVIDSLSDIGGQCAALYPDKPIYDIPGHPVVSGATLISSLEAQAKPFQPLYRLGVQVTDIDGDVEQGFCLSLSDGSQIKVKAVIIAAGAGCFGPNRPPLEGIEACEGKSVHYMVRRPDIFAGQRIAIAGGGDSAVDWAVALAEQAEHVTVIHRRDRFRAAQMMVERMQALAAAGKISLKTPCQMRAIDHENGRIGAVHIGAIGGEESERIAISHLLCFFGLATDLGPIDGWGLDAAQGGIPVSATTAQSKRPGIYAVGDIAQYDDKLKLILTGFSEAAMAAHHIKRRDHGGAFHQEYSTTKGIPGAD